MLQTIHFPAGPSAAPANAKVPKTDIGKGILVQVIAEGANLNAVHWNIPDGGTVPAHSHSSEQFGYLIKGLLELTVNGDTYSIAEGDTYVIPANAVHEFTARGQVEALDVFCPPRDLLSVGGR
jgi:unsaturated pyranuronate lyase